jgi:hypothetical protein
LHGRKRVVHVAVMRFVCARDSDDITHSCRFWKSPVFYRNFRRGCGFPFSEVAYVIINAVQNLGQVKGINKKQ